MSKNQIRKKILNLREKLYSENLSIKVEEVLKFIKKLNVKKKIIGCYYPVNYELNTIELIKKLIKNNYLVGLPVIKKNYHMDFYEYRTNDPLNVSRYGIPEPIKQKKLVPTILLIPMVAFDKNCNRLGYGGGFYDRTILNFKQNVEKKIFTVGLAFSCQKYSGKLPIDKNDKKIDSVLTEKGFKFFDTAN